MKKITNLLIICLLGSGSLFAQFERIELDHKKQRAVTFTKSVPLLSTIPQSEPVQIPEIETRSTYDSALLNELKRLKASNEIISNMKEELARKDSVIFHNELEKVSLLKKQLHEKYILLTEQKQKIKDTANNMLYRQSGKDLFSDSLLLQLTSKYFLENEQQAGKQLDKLAQGLEQHLDSFDYYYIFSLKQKRIAPEISQYAKEANTIFAEADALIENVNKWRIQVSAQLQKRELAKQEDTAQKSLDGLLSAIVPVATTTVIPNINIRATRSINTQFDDRRKGSLNAFLFLAPTSSTNNDTAFEVVQRKTNTNLLIPEASTMGFKLSWSFSWKGNTGGGKIPLATGLTLAGYYLNKTVPVQSEMGVISAYKSVGYTHFTQTVGWSLWDGGVEFSLSCHELLPVHDIDPYRAFFNDAGKMKAYLDVGVASLLNLNGASSKNYLLARVGFILNNGDIQQFMKPNDKALATIQLSFRPGF